MTKLRFLSNRDISRLCLTLLAVSLTLPFLPALGAPEDASRSKLKLSLPKKPIHRVPKKVVRKGVQQSFPNTLLVMPNKGDANDAMQKIREVNGTVVRTIGRGELTTWVVEFEDTEKFLAAEKELVNEKTLKTIQRDYIYTPQALNDPYYGSEWYVNNLQLEGAWQLSLGSANTIGVIDSGTSLKNQDLGGKIFAGYDAIKHKEGQKDVNGHGTMVATTAAAIGNNSLLTAGPARLSKIFPVRAGYNNGGVPTSAILEGVDQCGQRGIKIINLSVNSPPSYGSIASEAYQTGTPTNLYFKDFHDVKGGLIFNAAGNETQYDPTPIVPHLIVVSAIQEDNTYTDFSNYGACIWFAAPGIRIACSSKKGKYVSVAGTSFSSPLACGVAALIWGAKPGKTNVQIENILKSTAINNPPTSVWNMDYGYGRPNATAAMASP